MWNDDEMITSGMFSFGFGLTQQHNIFTESIGYGVAIETIQILRRV